MNVRPQDGTAIVTGKVARLPDSDRVLDAVGAVRGVENVIRELDVRAEERPDADIRGDITTAATGKRRRLRRHRSGRIPPPRHGSHMPRTIPGGGSRLTDGKPRKSVRDQLFWSPFTDAEDIVVSVNDGVVTLLGEVDSSRERGAAEDNAYDAGALRVENKLVVAR